MDQDGRPPQPAHPVPREVPKHLEPAGSIAPWRRSLDSVGSRWVDWSAVALVSHWLLIVNFAVGLYAFLPFAAPLMLAAGLVGPASVIFELYSYSCHQLASRSWFLLGNQMAFCERDAAMYPAMLVAGLIFGYRRRSFRSLKLKWFLLLIAPMALDGLTQAVGLRESTWLLRTITGALAGAALVWLVYPYFRRVIDDES